MLILISKNLTDPFSNTTLIVLRLNLIYIESKVVIILVRNFNLSLLITALVIS